MKLKYEKPSFITKINSQRKSNHLKSTSTDNIIINKFGQKNLINNNTRLTMEKTYFKNNLPNFQINNPNNINLRNQNNQLFKNYSNANYNGSLNFLQGKTIEILDNSYLKNYYISRLKEKPLNIKKIFIKSVPKFNSNNIEFIKVNKINQIKDELIDSELSKSQRQYLNNININNNINIKNVNDFNKMFNKNISLLKPSKKIINFIDTNKQKQYLQKKIQNLYNDENENDENMLLYLDNNQLYLDNFINNSARYEFPSYYNNEIYPDKVKYNLGKSTNFNNGSNNNISEDINHKNENKNNYNNNLLKYANFVKQYSHTKYFNNLKISNDILSIKSQKEDDNKISGNNFHIKGNNVNNITILSKSDINKAKLDKIFKEKGNEENNIMEEYNNLKEKINTIIEEKQLLKEDNYKLNEEINNLKNNSIVINDNYKNELEKLKEEIDKIKKEKDSLLSENKLIKEQDTKLRNELINMKKENELKNQQLDIMSKELLKLKEDINEEFQTSKINLEKLNEDFIALKKENIIYKENLELLEEEKEMELNQILKLQEENKALKLEQIQLNEQIDILQEENDELENTANIRDQYDQLIEEYSNFKNSEMKKYNQLLEEKNILKDELDKIKNKNKKEEISFPDQNNFILENHLNKKEIKDENIEEKIEGPFDNIIKLLVGQEGKVITKNKMGKKIFEE